MMNMLDVNDDVLQRLLARAQAENCTPNELLERLLDCDAAPREEIPCEQADYLRLLAENGQDLIYRLRFVPEMRFEYVSSSATKMVGYTPEEHYADPMLGYKLIHPDDRHLLDAAANEAPDEPLVLRWVRKDGSVMWTEQQNTPIYDDDGNIIALEGIARDITERKEAEEELQRTNDLLRRIFDTTHFSLAYMDADFNFIQVNELYARADGKTPDYFIGKNHFDLYPHAENEAIFRRVVETGEPYIVQAKLFEYPNNPGRGTTYWDWSLRPVFNAEGDVEGVVLILLDVTERVQAEEALRESEERYRTVADFNTEWTYWVKPDGMMYYVSPACEQIIGYTPEEIQQNPSLIYECVIGDDLPIWDAHQHAHTTEKTAQRIQFRLRHKDGTLRWIEHNCRPVVDADGNFDGYRVSNADITERKHAEEAMRASEQRLRMIVQGTRAGTWEWNILTGETLFNERWAEILGYTLDELAPIDIHTWAKLTHPDDLAEANKLLRQHLAGETDYYDCEARMKHKDGHWVWVWDRGKVMEWTADGKPLRMFGTHVDITERKRAEREKNETSELLQTIIDHIPVMIAFFDENGRFRFVNQHWTDRLGWIVEEMDAYGDPLALFYPDPDYRQRVIEYMLAAEPGWRDFVTHTKNGDVLNTSWANVRLSDGRSIGIGQDITERKRAERTIQETQTRYKLLTELTFEGIILHYNGVISDVNPSIVRMFGYERDELIGQQGIDLLFTPESAVIVRNNVQQNHALPYEVEAVRKDGSRFPVEIEACQINEELRVASLRDITQRKQAEAYALENERLKARFQKEQEQNALVQRIISTLSHDLRTPLTVIATSKDLLTIYFDRLSPEKRREKLENIGRQVQFALEILDDTVDIARGNLNPRSYSPGSVNLAALCEVSLDGICHAHGTQHRFTFVNEDRVETVSVDETLVSRILLNLLSNAVKYSPSESEIRLELARQGDWVTLRLVDQGMGIHPKDIERIFEPFYRTENVEGIYGTGLGLSIVKDCVERHQGRIWVDSQLGRGTVFTVQLPIDVNRTNGDV